MTTPTDPVATFGVAGAPIDGPAPAAQEPQERPERPAGGVDPDVAPVRRLSPLEALQAKLAADTGAELDDEGPTVELAVPGRPGVAVRYGTVVEWEELQAWRKRSRDKGLRSASNPDGVDVNRVSRLVLANRAKAVVVDGDDVVGTDGRPLTFSHPELHAMLGLTGNVGATQAVHAFYGRDAWVQQASGKVLDLAGWGDDAQEVDDDVDPPTAGQ